MKHLPNILSSLRIVGAVALLLCDVVGTTFWSLYALCGISDIADGWLARKLRCVTMKGALLDSLADICFVACCAWKLLPILELPQWLWLLAGVIVAIKVVPMTFWSIIPISIVAFVATFAAIQEGHVIRRNAPR